jgi:hypothetical protein
MHLVCIVLTVFAVWGFRQYLVRNRAREKDNSMATWFFDEFGSPIAFIGLNNLVFHKLGTFIGLLVDGKVWDKRGRYVGEVVSGDRLFRDKTTIHPPQVFPMLPYEPNIPSLPSGRVRSIPPPGFSDLEFDEEGYVFSN